MTAQRPNFLFIITDQQRADHLSCAGNPVLKTPHLDSLAHRGRRFENFFVNSGICQTNRATIMTGQTITQHGVRVNEFRCIGLSLFSPFAPGWWL